VTSSPAEPDHQAVPGRKRRIFVTAFTFDFTGFGQSGGAPRQLELPARKIADIAAAADFLSTMSFVREGGVGHVGICASAQ
jgi:hypothetical protein